jgi:Domain of unknown function (DUF4920)
MLKKLFMSALAIVVLASCGQSQSEKAAAAQQKAFGIAVNKENAIGYDDLLVQMATQDSLAVKVTGKVKDVCQKKGCWITLVSDDPSKPDMRVTFKDYAFFMPKDLSGKRVVLDGFARVEVTPVDVLRHYAEDAKKSKEEIEAITSPKREMNFEAAGVLILE